ncbi:hypothetical protein SKAU_G00018140 [Synaphobranchus kaupii]|uniref:Uncharacterized protein n=1 Tax=Synaphobranchus kaupii TaxID=118154 RepID=A0A9Q1GCK6_SYNKA|nr:hypothetical protein SKAU_G00018140 [Synaphobranchus kaupii]
MLNVTGNGCRLGVQRSFQNACHRLEPVPEFPATGSGLPRRQLCSVCRWPGRRSCESRGPRPHFLKLDPSEAGGAFDPPSTRLRPSPNSPAVTLAPIMTDRDNLAGQASLKLRKGERLVALGRRPKPSQCPRLGVLPPSGVPTGYVGEPARRKRGIRRAGFNLLNPGQRRARSPPCSSIYSLSGDGVLQQMGVGTQTKPHCKSFQTHYHRAAADGEHRIVRRLKLAESARETRPRD